MLYVASLVQLITQQSVQPRQYADDTQIFGRCNQTNFDGPSQRVSARLVEVDDWIRSIYLQLNTDKTELLRCSETRRCDSCKYHLLGSAVISNSHFLFASC